MNPLNSTVAETPGWKIISEVRPASISSFYKLGLGAVAIAMLLLPVLYVGIILLVAYSIYRHAVHPFYSLGESGWAALFGYLAPIVIGLILLFFMIKPLFRRQMKGTEAQQILPEDEPELFRFVNAICDLVRAPRPRYVRINLNVNASAGFNRGLLDLFGRNLTLTIGLPLVAGLTLREFGGVLAHEFGHFAQGAAMRLTFVVRSINNWFARVVYERDAWDNRLRSATTRGDFRLRIILYLARGTIWLTRRILWILMNIGHGISCFMLRQMEFDADGFETDVAGSAAFVATMQKVQLLTIGWQRTLAHQNEALATNRLVDNLPGLVAITANRISENVGQNTERSAAIGKTGWFDTHPTDWDRIQASTTIGSAGVLEAEGMATKLFRDFAATAQKQTTAYYAEECGVELNKVLLHPIEQMCAELEAATEQDTCVGKLFGPLLSFRTRFVIKIENPAQAADARLTERHAELLNESTSIVDSITKADHELLAARAALVLLNAGFTIDKKTFGLTNPSREAADAVVAHASSIIEDGMAKLESAVKMSTQRLAAGLAVYENSSDLAAKAEVEHLLELFARFESLGEVLVGLRNHTSALEHLLINPATERNANRWNTAATELRELIQQETMTVVSAFDGCKYPFAHARGDISLSEFLIESPPDRDATPQVFFHGRAVLERASTMYYRLLARLAVLANRAKPIQGRVGVNQTSEECNPVCQ